MIASLLVGILAGRLASGREDLACNFASGHESKVLNLGGANLLVHKKVGCTEIKSNENGWKNTESRKPRYYLPVVQVMAIFWPIELDFGSGNHSISILGHVDRSRYVSVRLKILLDRSFVRKDW